MNAVEYLKNNGWNDTKVALESPFGLGEFEHLWDDLKRLVESWGVIKTLGSLKSAKANLSEMYNDSSCDWVHENARLYDYKHLTVGRVKQAIADVEKCQ